MSMESVMPSSHLILCRPLLLLPPVSEVPTSQELLTSYRQECRLYNFREKTVLHTNISTEKFILEGCEALKTVILG